MHPFGDPRMARSTGWHPGSASPWWHRGGTGVALSWGSQQHPAAGLAPAETEKSRRRLRHLPPCLLSPIPFFSSSLQQNQPLWREALHAVGHRGCRFVPAGRSSSEMCLQVKSKTLRGALGAAPEGLFFFFLGMELMSLEAQNAKPYRMQLPADGAISSFALFYVGFPTPELHPHLVLMLPPHSSGVGNVCAFHRQCTGDLTAVGTRLQNAAGLCGTHSYDLLVASPLPAPPQWHAVPTARPSIGFAQQRCILLLGSSLLPSHGESRALNADLCALCLLLAHPSRMDPTDGTVHNCIATNANAAHAWASCFRALCLEAAGRDAACKHRGAQPSAALHEGSRSSCSAPPCMHKLQHAVAMLQPCCTRLQVGLPRNKEPRGSSQLLPQWRGVGHGRVQLSATKQIGLGGICRGPVWKNGLWRWLECHNGARCCNAVLRLCWGGGFCWEVLSERGQRGQKGQGRLCAVRWAGRKQGRMQPANLMPSSPCKSDPNPSVRAASEGECRAAALRWGIFKMQYNPWCSAVLRHVLLQDWVPVWMHTRRPGSIWFACTQGQLRGLLGSTDAVGVGTLAVLLPCSLCPSPCSRILHHILLPPEPLAAFRSGHHLPLRTAQPC